MALGDLYASAAELKTRLGITDANDDARITQAVTSASREIELFCGRQFNDAGSASERMYYADTPSLVVVDDFQTVTGLAVTVVEVDLSGTETTTVMTSAEIRSEPLSQVNNGITGWPYWSIRNISSTDWPQPPLDTSRNTHGYLKVTARWGWSAVPAAIKEATLILGEEFFKLKEAPFGIANWGEFGPIRVQDNRRALNLLRKYRRGSLRVA